MKTKFTTQAAMILFAGFVLAFTSGCCATANGTHRPLYPMSNVPGTRFLCNSNAPTIEAGTIPVFNLRSYDKGPFDVMAITPCGQVQHQTMIWVDKNGKWFVVGGAVGWGVVTGVGGLVDLGIDLGTKSYREFENNTVTFTFDSHMEKTPSFMDNNKLVQPSPSGSPRWQGLPPAVNN